MRAIIQRSKNSQVTVKNKIVGQIKYGLVVLVGFTYEDTEEDIEYIVKKILNLRIFNNENHIMNKSILDVKGSILSISQFTLYAESKKGNRPSYKNALDSINAEKLYKIFNEKLKKHINVQTGIFGEEMIVNINNDGPVTLILESRDKGDKK